MATKNTKSHEKVFVVFCVFCGQLLSGCVSSPAPRVSELHLPAEEQRAARENLRMLDIVWSTVNGEYYDRAFNGADWPAAARKFGPQAALAPDRPSLYAAINGMLGELHDAHTGASAPAIAREQNLGQRALTGIRLVRVGGRWVVGDVTPGGPAAEAGVQRGWLIVSRDGAALPENLVLPSLAPGQAVRWEFLDSADKRIELTLVARSLPLNQLRFTVLPGGELLLRFEEFDWWSAHWVRQQLKEHRSAPGVILDLRTNRGGNVFMLASILGEFFPGSIWFGALKMNWGPRVPLPTFSIGSAHYSGPLAVLVDGPTASAAEVLAAAIQERGRGPIIGRKTGGNVLVARMRPLPDGGVLEFSFANWVTHAGRRLEGAGVTPDIAVEPTLDTLRAGRDPDIEAALAAFGGKR